MICWGISQENTQPNLKGIVVESTEMVKLRMGTSITVCKEKSGEWNANLSFFFRFDDFSFFRGPKLDKRFSTFIRLFIRVSRAILSGRRCGLVRFRRSGASCKLVGRQAKRQFVGFFHRRSVARITVRIVVVTSAT